MPLTHTHTTATGIILRREKKQHAAALDTKIIETSRRYFSAEKARPQKTADPPDNIPQATVIRDNHTGYIVAIDYNVAPKYHPSAFLALGAGSYSGSGFTDTLAAINPSGTMVTTIYQKSQALGGTNQIASLMPGLVHDPRPG